MKKPITIEELSVSWYYRLAKVLFVITFIFCSLFSIIWVVKYFYPVAIFNPDNSKLICLEGNKKTYSYSELVYQEHELDIKNNVLKIKNDAIPYVIIDKCNLIQGYYCEPNPKDNQNLPERGGLLKNTDIVDISSRTRCYDQILASGIGKYYEVDKFYDTQGGWSQIILFSFLSLIGIALCFEIIRRIFYYIVFGAFNPK